MLLACMLQLVLRSSLAWQHQKLSTHSCRGDIAQMIYDGASGGATLTDCYCHTGHRGQEMLAASFRRASMPIPRIFVTTELRAHKQANRDLRRTA